MTTKTKLVFIDNWYPWANAIIIENKTYNISDGVNSVLWNIYENNGFPDSDNPRVKGMPRGPYEITLIWISAKGSPIVDGVICNIEYKGLDTLHVRKQKRVRDLIKGDRKKANAWNEYQRGLRVIGEENNSTVGWTKKQGVKNTVIIWEKMLHLGK